MTIRIFHRLASSSIHFKPGFSTTTHTCPGPGPKGHTHITIWPCSMTQPCIMMSHWVVEATLALRWLDKDYYIRVLSPNSIYFLMYLSSHKSPTVCRKFIFCHSSVTLNLMYLTLNSSPQPLVSLWKLSFLIMSMAQLLWFFFFEFHHAFNAHWQFLNLEGRKNFYNWIIISEHLFLYEGNT